MIMKVGERHGVSIHCQLEFLFNSLSTLISRGYQRSVLLATGIFPHKRPVMQKTFPYNEVIKKIEYPGDVKQ